MLNVPYSTDYALTKALTQAIVVAASSGDNALVAAPGAGKQLVVAYLKGQRTSGSTATTAVLVKTGSSTTIDYGDFSNDIPGQVFWEAATELQLRVLPENTALIANHSAANSITYTVRYLIREMTA